MIDGTCIAASPKAQIEALEARIATLEAAMAMVESKLVFSLMDHAQLKDRILSLESFRDWAPHEEARLRCELTQEIGQLTRRLELCGQPSGKTAE